MHIDDLKKVNDEGGHDYGDRLLVEVAQTLKHNLRAFDMVARYGGDEFVLNRLIQQADKLVYAAKQRGRTASAIGVFTAVAPSVSS